MEVEAGCLLAAIERVAKDRGIQSFPVGTMYTELVGTSRVRIESEAEMLVVFFVSKNFVFRNRFLSLFMIYNLAWTIEIVGHQREREDAFWLDASFFRTYDGYVFLLYLMTCKLFLQPMVGKLCFGNHHESACSHVQPVYNQRTVASGYFLRMME